MKLKHAIFSVGPQPGKRKRTDKWGLTYVSQSEVAVEGPVRLVSERDSFWGGPESRDFVSKIYMNPTWRQVLAAFDASIPVTGDYHHQFLEGLHDTGKQEAGVKFYRFSTGS